MRLLLLASSSGSLPAALPSMPRRPVPALGVLLAVFAAACGDERVTTPSADPDARRVTVAGDVVSPAPAAFKIGPAGFQERFTHIDDVNRPDPVRPWEPATWSVVRHVQDPQYWYKIEPAMAWHGTMCQRPDHPTEPTHPIGQYQDLVFLCRNHVMTATNASSYGVTYLTPDRMVDFDTGTAVVRFDVATLRESGRDWIDLWVTPYADNLVAPVDDSIPDLQGEPRRAVHLRMTDQRTRSAFEASVVRDFKGTRLPSLTTDGYEKAFADRGLAQSATRRDTFELHISRTRVRFGMPTYNLWWVDAPVEDLGWSRGVIQLGHHSFNPAADGGKPTSWHWDNVGMQPAVPFTILRADRRFVDDTSTDEVVFPRGAPAGASLRFAAIGPTDVRFNRDGGVGNRGWTRAVRQAQKRDDAERFSSYWMPVPEGTTRVRFRADPARARQDTGPWMVRDISIWAAPGQQPAVESGNNKGNQK